MSEEIANQLSGYEEIKHRERIRYLAELMTGPKKQKHNSSYIYRDELEKDIDAIIEEEAIDLYKRLTGKKIIPDRGVPQEYKDRALMDILRRWQSALKEIKLATEKTVPPAYTKYVKEGPPVCPKCGEIMRRIVGSLFQCKKCYYVIRL